MDMIRFIAAILITVALCSCAPTAPGGPGSAPGAAPAAPPVVKIITIATLVQIKGFGPWDIGSTTGGWAPLNELHSVGLVADATRGGLEPRLAAKLPSLDDGSIRLLPDGRM